MSQILEMELALTDQRKGLHEMEQLVSLLLSQKISKRAETTLALRSTQLAMMWLGKAKGALGIPTPYVNSTDPTNKVIEPRADVAGLVQPFPDDAEEVVVVKRLRKDLSEIANRISRNMEVLTDNRKYQAAVEEAWVQASNANMWLGMVLGAIRDEESKPKPEKKKTVLEKVVEKITPAKTETNIGAPVTEKKGLIGTVVDLLTPNPKLETNGGESNGNANQ